jgi:hypothetical protein
LLVLSIATGLGLPGCDRGGERACSPEDRGTVWATAGAGSPALHRIDLCPLRVVSVAPGAAVFSVAAAGDVVVVATDPTAPPPDVGGAGDRVAAPAAAAFGGRQRLARLVDGRLEPLPGLGDRPAGDPALGPDGRIAFVVNEAGPANVSRDRLFVYEPATGAVAARYATERTVERPAWGAAGALAAYRVPLPGEQPEVVIIPPEGPVRIVPVARGLAVDGPPLQLTWGHAGQVTLTFFVHGQRSLRISTLVVEPDTGVERTLPDLHALAWSPDGRRLLVQDQRNHLGYVSPPRLADFHRLGDVGPSGFVDAAWAS